MKTQFITIKDLIMDFLVSTEDCDEKSTEMVRVLDNINLELSEGEIVGVIGRSGCGKTVLIHLIRGIDQAPTSGKIIYHISRCPKCGKIEFQSDAGKPCPACGDTLVAEDVDFWDPENGKLKTQIMARTSLMFQRTFALYGDERVIENVLRALDDINYPSEKAISRAADLLDEVRLTHRMMHISRDLSGGEKQRVVLARQLAREPLFLCADEPTGTLDPKTARVVHDLLKKAAKENNMGMIVTSHFSQVLEDVCDRAVLLDDGKITKIGTPDEIVTEFMKGYHDDRVYTDQIFGDPIVKAEHLLKKFIAVDRGVINAVNDITFEINEREIFGIIGVSGGGKTTLSKMIAGLYEPTSGKLEVRIGDEWVDMSKPGYLFRGRAKQYIGLLHQEYDLYPHRTIIDNLTDAIGLEFPKELATRKALITLRMAGFTEKKAKDVLHRLPSSLSEGEKHRVALAQILIREPRIILLDEPTGTMDPITKVDVKHSIMHAREEMEETFVIVSHDMEFVRDVCDRCMFMRGGKIIAIGPTHEVLDNLSEDEKIVMKHAVEKERARAETGAPKKATLAGGGAEAEATEGALHEKTDEMFEMQVGIMTDIRIFLNGEQKTVEDTATIKDLLPNQPEGTSVVLLLPGSVSGEKTPHLRLTTTAGDIVIELAKKTPFPLPTGEVKENLRVHFDDRNSVSFGPFPQVFTPDKNSYRYERGVVCLGSGGYDAKNAYLTFSRREHMADHGAAKGGAVLGKVIYGLGIMNRWKNGDTITQIEDVFSITDSTNSEVTSDLSAVVKDGMQIFSELVITAKGYQENHAEIDCGCTESVEHMLFCLRENRLQIDRTTSTYIRDHNEGKLFVPQERQKPRREGTVTIRTAGKGSGGLYIYTRDVPSNQHHTRTGLVTRGIELAKFSTEKTVLSVTPVPELLDLRGLPLDEAVSLVKTRGLKVMADNRDVKGRVVIGQKPETTLEILKEGKVSLYTMDLANVIDISLDYKKAPLSVDLFRRVTGLKRYAVGTMPLIYNVDDEMYLFKPPFSSGTNIIPENTPKKPVKTNTLALTNDSRYAVGMVGVRVVENTEYGPTGEPFGGTNIIGKVIDMDKLSLMKEGVVVYIREVKE